jgi:hypothetical protein
VYFHENELAGDGGFEPRDSYGQWVDGAVSQTIARAIRDATQTADPARQQEAAAWLWICCPDIAEQVDLPELDYEAMPVHATSYVMGG